MHVIHVTAHRQVRRGHCSTQTECWVLPSPWSIDEEKTLLCLAAAQRSQGGGTFSMKRLLRAAHDGNITALKKMLRRNQHQLSGSVAAQALMLAAAHGHTACVQALLEVSPEVQVAAADETGCTALMIAARNGHTECVRALLEVSPEVQVAAADETGCTALLLAAWKGHAACVNVLLEVSPTAQVAAWNTLMAAAGHGHTAVVQAIVQVCPTELVAGADETGCTALMAAARNGHTACVRALLEVSPAAQVAAADADGCTALMMAAGEGRTECVRALLGVTPAVQLAASRYGQSALMQAELSGHTECVRVLKEVAERISGRESSGTRVSTAAATPVCGQCGERSSTVCPLCLQQPVHKQCWDAYRSVHVPVCTGKPCMKCGNQGPHKLLCGGCMAVWYCSKDCQLAHGWEHGLVCKGARTCVVCGKTGFHRCRCKQASYCSPTCQLAHWPEHCSECADMTASLIA
jgi:ankyrin repeat protein